VKDVVTRALAVSAVALAIAAATAGAAGAPRSLTTKCVDTSGVRAHPFWITTADRVRLYAIEAGHGPTAVVLAHEYPADLCGWLPYVRTLTAAGLRVLAFDFRNYGDSGGRRTGSRPSTATSGPRSAAQGPTARAASSRRSARRAALRRAAPSRTRARHGAAPAGTA